jgi:hypothetical protein
VTWPATPAVARAYVDQLTRSKTLTPERAEIVRAAVAQAGRAGSGKGAEAAGRMDGLAAELERAADGATGQDALRLRSLAATLKGLGNAAH